MLILSTSYIIGCPSITPCQNFTHAWRFRIQNIWPWFEIRKLVIVHDVCSCGDGINIDAIILPSGEFKKVWHVLERILLHVPNTYSRGMARSYGKNHGTSKFKYNIVLTLHYMTCWVHNYYTIDTYLSHILGPLLPSSVCGHLFCIVPLVCYLDCDVALCCRHFGQSWAGWRCKEGTN